MLFLFNVRDVAFDLVGEFGFLNILDEFVHIDLIDRLMLEERVCVYDAVFGLYQG